MSSLTASHMLRCPVLQLSHHHSAGAQGDAEALSRGRTTYSRWKTATSSMAALTRPTSSNCACTMPRSSTAHPASTQTPLRAVRLLSNPPQLSARSTLSTTASYARKYAGYFMLKLMLEISACTSKRVLDALQCAPQQLLVQMEERDQHQAS